MAKSLTLDSAVLNLILNGIGIAGIADDAATSPLTELYVSLHTADPTGAGNQTTNEVTYPGYNRAAIARNPSGPAWVVSGQYANPAANIIFPEGTGGGGIATYCAVGTAAGGAGEILYSGPITGGPSGAGGGIILGSGQTPYLSTATAITEA